MLKKTINTKSKTTAEKTTADGVINTQRANIKNYKQSTGPYEASSDSIGEHNHKHIHINKGPDLSANVKELCDLEAKSVPNDILTVMNNNKQNIKTYNYD